MLFSTQMDNSITDSRDRTGIFVNPVDIIHVITLHAISAFPAYLPTSDVDFHCTNVIQPSLGQSTAVKEEVP